MLCAVRGHHEEKGYESDESDIWEGFLILKRLNEMVAGLTLAIDAHHVWSLLIQMLRALLVLISMLLEGPCVTDLSVGDS